MWHSPHATLAVRCARCAFVVGPVPWHVVHAVGPSLWQLVHATPALPPAQSSPWQLAHSEKLQSRRRSSSPWKSELAGFKMPGAWIEVAVSASEQSTTQLVSAGRVSATASCCGSDSAVKITDDASPAIAFG